MSKKQYPSEAADRFIVRLPDGMRDRIKKAADENKRSMNQEVVDRLERSFASEPEALATAAEEIDALRRLLHRQREVLLEKEAEFEAWTKQRREKMPDVEEMMERAREERIALREERRELRIKERELAKQWMEKQLNSARERLEERDRKLGEAIDRIERREQELIDAIRKIKPINS